MQDIKTRKKHQYFTRGRVLKVAPAWQRRVHMNCDTRRRNHVHFFGKAKIRRENKMKKTSKQDTGFVPRQIQIWKCAKPSESVRSAVKLKKSATGFEHRVQNVLRVQNAVSWVSAVGAHFRGCV